MRLILVPLQVHQQLCTALRRHELLATFDRNSRRRLDRLVRNLVAEHAVVYDHDAGDACVGVITRRWRR